MTIEVSEPVVGRRFSELWGPEFNPHVIDELAHPVESKVITASDDTVTTASLPKLYR